MKYKINVQDNGNREFSTVRDLIEEIDYWKKWALENNKVEEFMNAKINLSLHDIEGRCVDGDCFIVAG